MAYRGSGVSAYVVSAYRRNNNWLANKCMITNENGGVIRKILWRKHQLGWRMSREGAVAMNVSVIYSGDKFVA